MLDIRWLEDLIALAETGSFTRAADRRNVTQSGFSRRIQSLEQWARAPLVDRTGTPLRLTDAGYEVLGVAQSVVGAVTHLRDRLTSHAAGGRSTTIRIAAPHLMGVNFFQGWFPQVEAVLGHLPLVVTSLNVQPCFAALDRGDVDFVICLADQAGHLFERLPQALRPDPAARALLGRDVLIPLTACDQAQRPRYRLGFGRVPVLDYPQDCSLNWSLDLARTHWPDVDLCRAGSAHYSDGLRLMARRGLGVAWLPRSITTADRAERHLVRAGGPEFDVPLVVQAIRRQARLSADAEAFWQDLVAGRLGGPEVPPAGLARPAGGEMTTDRPEPVTGGLL